MKNFFNRLAAKYRVFMQGRYGNDELSRFLSVCGMVLLLLSLIPFLRILYFLALALLIWVCFRSFSRSVYKRQAERNFYLLKKRALLSWFNNLKRRWADRKTHKYYKCPQCRKLLRVPKGKGKIRITCPQCQTSFSKKT